VIRHGQKLPLPAPGLTPNPLAVRKAIPDEAIDLFTLRALLPSHECVIVLRCPTVFGFTIESIFIVRWPAAPTAIMAGIVAGIELAVRKIGALELDFEIFVPVIILDRNS
jgi:hypothetical protein